MKHLKKLSATISFILMISLFGCSDIFYSEQSENAVKETMLNSLRLAIDEVNNYSLYTMKPFDTASGVRDYPGNYIQTTEDEAYASVIERTESGGDRNDIIAEYTGDEAFELWFSIFDSSIKSLVK